MSFFGSSSEERTTTSTEAPPRLVLAPANATVSEGVSVILGCKANTPVRTCHWAFYSSDAPLVRNDLAPFSPMSKHRRKNGRRDDADCSLDLDNIAMKHKGKWVCSLLPLRHGKMFLISKPAFLDVLDAGSVAASISERPGKISF